MEELIFIALILFFSVLESIARQRKKRAGGTEGELPGGWRPDEPEEERSRWPGAERPEGVGAPPGEGGPPRRERAGERAAGTATPVPTYDADGSYEDVSLDEAASSSESVLSERRGSASERKPPVSSEGMIPAEIWREIEALGRGGQAEAPVLERRRRPAARPGPLPGPRPAPKPPAPVARPRPAAPRPRTPPPASPPREAPLPRRAEGERVHLAHADFGTDPSERAPSPRDRLEPIGRMLGRDAAAARRRLRGRDGTALREAVILQEILGPPVSMRPEPFFR